MRSAAQRVARAAAATATKRVSSLRVVQRNALQRNAFAHTRAFKNGKLAPTIQHLSSACMSTSASDDKGEQAALRYHYNMYSLGVHPCYIVHSCY